jgi:membrane-bound ClpP family serine protease
MWAIAGALLGAFVVLSVLGALTGPHLHVGALVAGAAAAVALVVVALAEASSSLAWTLFGLDLCASALVGLSAWRALRPGARAGSAGGAAAPTRALLGTEGVAIGALQPEGVVRVGGEQWSAVSLNGPAAPGTKVQVVGISGLRLEVWNEEAGTGGLPRASWPQQDRQEGSA